MPLPRVLVKEAGRRWIGQVRSKLEGMPVRVHHCTGRQECLELMRGRQGSTVVLQLAPSPRAMLELLEEAHASDPSGMLLVIAGPSDLQYEVAARELGAAAFICEPIRPDVLTELVERAVRRQLELVGFPQVVVRGS